MGILINRNLNILATEVYADKDTNILALRLTIEGTSLIICAVYGPNSYCADFFKNIEGVIKDNCSIPVILCGDWNCTYSAGAVCDNPDVFNMKNLPNKKHSELLNALCAKYNLADPYRCFHPKKRDFTYIPRDTLKTNRSRLDFFICSKKIIADSKSVELKRPFKINYLTIVPCSLTSPNGQRAR